MKSRVQTPTQHPPLEITSLPIPEIQVVKTKNVSRYFKSIGEGRFIELKLKIAQALNTIKKDETLTIPMPVEILRNNKEAGSMRNALNSMLKKRYPGFYVRTSIEAASVFIIHQEDTGRKYQNKNGGDVKDE